MRLQHRRWAWPQDLCGEHGVQVIISQDMIADADDGEDEGMRSDTRRELVAFQVVVKHAG